MLFLFIISHYQGQNDDDGGGGSKSIAWMNMQMSVRNRWDRKTCQTCVLKPREIGFGNICNPQLL